MKLRNQLFLAICLFLLVAFSGSFYASLESSREQRWASCAPMPRTPRLPGPDLDYQIDDPAMMELMVSSIFDSGIQRHPRHPP